MFSQKFKITNLDCPACVHLSVNALEDIPGVIKAEVLADNGQATIEADREISWPEIVNSLKEVGKEAALN